ncbi:MAG: ABC transporter ATP-binding protein [Chloroflexi bacterium]|nr:ABC transporter ATP-binding protein [Chloroflexota bacterium]
MESILEVCNLTTHFATEDGLVKAVNGVSYNVAKGETIALVGESGSGKTVSALSILRLIQEPPGKIVSGSVTFEGVDLLKLSGEEIRRVRGAKIAMVFQEPMTSLNPVLTIGRQISETLELHQQMGKQEALRETIRLLGVVGIPQAERRVKDYPHHFSGGMRQRAMIAMAISCRPQVLIADEPTTALDATIQAQLLELLRGITRELGTSVIMITHNLGIVARYARRVYVMYAGGIVEHGLAQMVYDDPRHPYVAGLLASVPRLDEARKTRLVSIGGQPPDLMFPPPGCTFRPRCSYADQCRESDAGLIEVAPGHYSSCQLGQQRKPPWSKTL